MSFSMSKQQPIENEEPNLHHVWENGWTIDGQTEPEEVGNGGDGGSYVASTQEQKQLQEEEQKLSVLPSMAIKEWTKQSKGDEDDTSIKPVQVEEQVVVEIPPSLYEEQSLSFRNAKKSKKKEKKKTAGASLVGQLSRWLVIAGWSCGASRSKETIGF